ncbi:uncharacterized protein PHALS_15012 [Plasmopara halstedii]|uniref:Uncharacterized protein n=1 Tax=Plasmopara halstedii TaxID=4781 RepID=A0A0N7L3W5_PLAHL|nr:uncharacterized protein PHALS_15012 [Plasmopara halstedii]CEG37011.1 hypothetical protein PHALS_15012 [Plasmopara halstedii]|eukprot:XP_024573380.1 hypothetical protein PHALS_15012 [Plasmopara halstedii]
MENSCLSPQYNMVEVHRFWCARMSLNILRSSQPSRHQSCSLLSTQYRLLVYRNAVGLGWSRCELLMYKDYRQKW